MRDGQKTVTAADGDEDSAAVRSQGRGERKQEVLPDAVVVTKERGVFYLTFSLPVASSIGGFLEYQFWLIVWCIFGGNVHGMRS